VAVILLIETKGRRATSIVSFAYGNVEDLTMNRDDILFLFGYHYWATERILNRLGCVTGEQFDAPSPAPHGSLRSTLLHALGAETIWRQRMQEGLSPTSLPVFDDVQRPDEMRAAWEPTAKRCAPT